MLFGQRKTATTKTDDIIVNEDENDTLLPSTVNHNKIEQRRQQETLLTSSSPAASSTTTTTTIVPQQQGQQQKERTKNELNGAMAGIGSSSEEFCIGLASGIVFGLVSPALGHPFDSVKTRMQADPLYHNATMRQTIIRIYTTDGIVHGFYRGFIPPLLGSMTFRGLQFSIYGASYSYYETTCSYYNNPIPYTFGLRPSIIFGAFMASIVRSAIESPLDYIKVRKMVGQATMHDNTISTTTNTKLNTIINTTTKQQVSKLGIGTEVQEFFSSPIHNIQQLYKGFVPTFLRTFGLLGSFFIMVDYSVRYVPDLINAPTFGPFFKGAICSTVAWFFAFPFESAKSIIQGDGTGKYTRAGNNVRYPTIYALMELYKERGIIHGWYRGFGPGAGRSFFANGTSMVVFSYVQDFIRSNI